MLSRPKSSAFAARPVNLKLRPAILFLGLIFAAFGPARPAEIPCIFTGVDKVVAVGDLHGDYSNFVKILTETELVDKDLHWSAGQTHLVQTGDILDRGTAAKRIFDLLIRLEKEAEQAGGKVHALIGNHEEMALDRISFDYPGYVTVEQFQDFLPQAFVQEKTSQFLKKKMEGLPEGAEPPPIDNDELQQYWKKIMEDEGAQDKYYRFLRENYGAWILSHNVVIKINDIVFAHGGISEAYSKWPLEKINSVFRQELNLAMHGKFLEHRQILYIRDSPLWYRGLALNDENSMAPEVDRILANLKAGHMVIAHTRHAFVTPESMERFQRKIWVIDTGISTIYGGHYSALIIEGRNFRAWGVMSGGK